MDIQHYHNHNKMEDDIKSLNERFTDKTILYRERYYLTKELSDLIIKLDNSGYAFIRSQFDTFIVLATYKKGNSYIVRSQDPLNKKVASIMFSKFVPNTKQFKLLFECYKSPHYCDYTWVDTLKQHYTFTPEQKVILQNIKYDMSKMFANNVTLTLDEMKILLQSEINKRGNFIGLQTIIETNNIEYPNDFISWFIKQLLTHYDKHTIYKNALDIFLVKLKLPFDDQAYKYIYEFKSCQFAHYCINNGFVPNEDFVKLCCNSTIHMEMIFYLHNTSNLKITTDMMNSLLQSNYVFSTENRHANGTSHTNLLIDFGYTEDIIKQSIYKINRSEYISIYTLCKLIGILPNTKTFEIAITNKYYNIIDECLKNLKILPTNHHLQLALSSFGFQLDILESLLCYKISPGKQDFDAFIKGHNYSNTHMLETLIKYGLKLDLEDITKALSRTVSISNLERFNIPYDEKLYFSCYINNYYPYDDFMIIDKHILELRKMCRNKDTTLSKFTDYIKDNNVIVDKYCFDHACDKNYILASHLINEYKSTMTMFYWYNSYAHTRRSSHFIKYIETHKITEETMISSLELSI